MADREDLGNIWHRRQISRWGVVLLTGLFLAAWSSGAEAQINPFRSYRGPTLSKEDLASGQAAANKLLTEDQAQVGKTEDWAGPSSGNTGNITVQKAFQRQGMPCRTLRSEIRYKSQLDIAPDIQPECLPHQIRRVEIDVGIAISTTFHSNLAASYGCLVVPSGGTGAAV